MIDNLLKTVYSRLKRFCFEILFPFVDIVSYKTKFSVTLPQLHLLQRYCKISTLIRELNELNSNKRFYRIQNIKHIKVAGKVKLTLAFME